MEVEKLNESREINFSENIENNEDLLRIENENEKLIEEIEKYNMEKKEYFKKSNLIDKEIYKVREENEKLREMLKKRSSGVWCF